MKAGYNTLLIALAVFLSSVTLAGFKVDYTADAYSCGANWDGAPYDCTKVYDNDGGTYGQVDTIYYGASPCRAADIVFNYSIPTGVNQTGSYLKIISTSTLNAEVPVACWNYSGESLLTFNVTSEYSPSCGGQSVDIFCYTGAAWQDIGGGGSYGRVYEDAMYFNYTQYDIGYCSPPNTEVTINITILNETSLGSAKADVGFSYFLYNNDYTYVSNSSINFSGVTGYEICLNEDTNEGYLDIIARHENVSFRTEDYIKRKLFISNDTQNFTVYLLPDDDNDYDILFTVQDYTGKVYPNYLVEALKKDFYTNAYRLVDTELAGHSGAVTMALDIVDEFYIMRVRDTNNVLVAQTNAMKIVETENTLLVQRPEDQSFLNEYLTVKNGLYNLSDNGSHAELQYSFTNSDLTCLLLIWVNATGRSVIGTNCSNSSGTILTLDVPANSSTTAYLTVEINGRNYTIETFDIYNVVTDPYTMTKLFFAFMIILLAGVAGAAGGASMGGQTKIIALTTVSVALILVTWAKLIALGYSAIMGFLIVAVVIILGRKKQGVVQ